MFARRAEFERPSGSGLSRFLASRGWRTVAFDFRGHGDSGPAAASGASWTYDDLVQRDMPAVVACARARAKKHPLAVVGHSLGGHVALAALGLGLLDADAIVGVAANVWIESLEPSRARWAAKRAILGAVLAVSRRRGYFPARALGLGSDDESLAYFTAFHRYAKTGVWGSDDGRLDYLAATGNVKVPVLSIASEGDRLSCNPDCAERLFARCAGLRAFERVRRADDGGRPPSHMGLVTSEAARSVWARAEAWMRRATVS